MLNKREVPDNWAKWPFTVNHIREHKDVQHNINTTSLFLGGKHQCWYWWKERERQQEKHLVRKSTWVTWNTEKVAYEINNKRVQLLLLYISRPPLLLSPVYKSTWGKTHASTVGCEWLRLLWLKFAWWGWRGRLRRSFMRVSGLWWKTRIGATVDSFWDSWRKSGSWLIRSLFRRNSPL